VDELEEERGKKREKKREKKALAIFAVASPEPPKPVRILGEGGEKKKKEELACAIINATS